MKDIRKDYLALISLSENTLGMARDLLKTVTQFHRVDETDWMRWIDVLLGQISNTMGACTNTCFILKYSHKKSANIILYCIIRADSIIRVSEARKSIELDEARRVIER